METKDNDTTNVDSIIDSIISDEISMFKQKRGKKRKNVMEIIREGKNPACIVSNVVSYVIFNIRQNQRAVAMCGKDKLPVYFDPKIFAFSQQSVCLAGSPPV